MDDTRFLDGLDRGSNAGQQNDVELDFSAGATVPGRMRAPGMRPEGGLLVRDFAPRPAEVRRILVFKLDHHGDFVIGLPALCDLRQAFPQARIRLVCGRWNAAAANASGLVDDVRTFDYFPERAVDWNGAPPDVDWVQFATATEGRFDLAIDLRVDEDTRPLLARVDAAVRCGIGSQARFPMLDVALPDVSRELIPNAPAGRPGLLDPGGAMSLPPDTFESEMDCKSSAWHETRFIGREPWLLRSENVMLPLGRYSAVFALEARRFLPGLQGVGVAIEVIANGEHRVAAKVFGRRSIRRLDAAMATLLFESAGEPAWYDFRVRLEGRALAGRLRFSGLKLQRVDRRIARFRPSELHVGEKLSLLVSLIRQRTGDLTVGPAAAPARAPGSPLRIVVAPFSNSTVRDWPPGHYATLIRLLLGRLDGTIAVIGAPTQAGQAATLLALLGEHAAGGRVLDLVGKTQWSDMPEILRAADLVICNNSGIAHQAAGLGAPTLAIYSGSHQPLEWGPRGPRARAVMLPVPCSPCGWERVEDCPNDHMCMRMITPQAVLEQATRVLGARLVPAGRVETVA